MTGHSACGSLARQLLIECSSWRQSARPGSMMEAVRGTLDPRLGETNTREHFSVYGLQQVLCLPEGCQNVAAG